MTCPVPGCRRLPFFVADPCDPSKCARCQREDAGEHAAIQVEGEPVEAFEAARAAILRERMPGQRRLVG